jgi:hypothetical protein
MAMGSVVRVVLRFKKRFWTADDIERRAGGESLESLTFVQSDDEDFPVWWTQYPLRAPVMVGSRGSGGAVEAWAWPPVFADSSIRKASEILEMHHQRVP